MRESGGGVWKYSPLFLTRRSDYKILLICRALKLCTSEECIIQWAGYSSVKLFLIYINEKVGPVKIYTCETLTWIYSNKSKSVAAGEWYREGLFWKGSGGNALSLLLVVLITQVLLPASLLDCTLKANTGCS